MADIDDVLWGIDLTEGKRYLATASGYCPAISPNWVAWAEWSDETGSDDLCFAPLSQLEGTPSAPAESPVSSSPSSGGGYRSPEVAIDLASGGSESISAHGISVSVETPGGGKGRAVCLPTDDAVEISLEGEPGGVRIVVSGGALCVLDEKLGAWAPVDGAVYGVIGAVYRDGSCVTALLLKEGRFAAFKKLPNVKVVLSADRVEGFARGLSSARVVLNGADRPVVLHEGGFRAEFRLGPGRHNIECVVERDGRKFVCFKKNFWWYADFEKHWSYATAGSFLEEHPEVFGETLYLLPDLPAKRGEVAKLLKAALDLPDLGGDVPFRDVPPSDGTLASAARAVYDASLMVGYPDGTLGAGKDISRVENIVLLGRVAKKLGVTPGFSGGAPFKDFGQVPAWAKNEVAEAAALGIAKGYPDGTFRPLAKVTRAESPVVVLRVARTAPSKKV
ncbi:MAG: S-layer homology domain-containing protein [Bacillota bacterium]